MPKMKPFVFPDEPKRTVSRESLAVDEALVQLATRNLATAKRALAQRKRLLAEHTETFHAEEVEFMTYSDECIALQHEYAEAVRESKRRDEIRKASPVKGKATV